jgi:hypothetical protein
VILIDDTWPAASNIYGPQKQLSDLLVDGDADNLNRVQVCLAIHCVMQTPLMKRNLSVYSRNDSLALTESLCGLQTQTLKMILMQLLRSQKENYHVPSANYQVHG